MKNKTVEQLAEEYADIHMEKFDISNSMQLPYYHNDRHKVEDAFESGFSARKEIEQKILTDTLNKYRSWLSQETSAKLTKTANYERVVSYKAYIEILEELKNKLK
jgi:hypothetical protein